MRAFLRMGNRLLFYLLVVFVVVYSVFPFYWAVISSFKPSDALFASNPSLLPLPFTLDHYRNVFIQANFGRNLLNSLMVAGGATLLSLTLGVLAAYALGRLPFPPKNAVLYLVLAMTMFPQIAVLGGLFMLLRQAGLYPFLLYSSSMTVADHLTLNELWRRVKKAKDPIEKHRFLAVYH
ncbi:carbohydrate ABC transporter permease, partial [Thermus scotoductus]|uniref:carbohydrate ABC transporter permease n=1 Tax=Thermus scotoductus TaxID=37636 RepID=UPI003F50D8FE